MKDDRISVVINADTRPPHYDIDDGRGGCVSRDFLADNVQNKINFFNGYNFEIILYVEVHEQIEPEMMSRLHEMQRNGAISDLIIHNRNPYLWGDNRPDKYVDMNILQALFYARGKYVFHFDGDTMIFRPPESPIIDQYLDWLETYEYVSYCTPWTPRVDCDPQWDYQWVSSRFFCCKTRTLKYDEILKCIYDCEYMYKTYGEKYRRCPWLEHIQGILSHPDKILYPPYEFEKYVVFCWKTYREGLIRELNQMSYSEVMQRVQTVHYPCDVTGGRL